MRSSVGRDIGAEVDGEGVLAAGDGVPDLEAAKRLPITEVADALALEREGFMVRCWRPQNHQHADRTPSVGIWRRRNRVRCFVCDARALSGPDLAMSVLGVDLLSALLWLDARFGLPRLPKGKHIVRRSKSELGGRAGVLGRLESLIRSGLLAEMSEAEVRLVMVLDAFADPHTYSCRISYAGLRRFSGLAKDSSVSRALKLLERLGVIEITRGRGGRGVSECSQYSLTLESSEFLSHARACHAATREAIEVERELRAQLRAQKCCRTRSSTQNRGPSCSPAGEVTGADITGKPLCP